MFSPLRQNVNSVLKEKLVVAYCHQLFSQLGGSLLGRMPTVALHVTPSEREGWGWFEYWATLPLILPWGVYLVYFKYPCICIARFTNL
jgi:hypothetical protein